MTARIPYLWLVALLTLGMVPMVGAGQARGAGKERPNIVWFIMEDMGPDFACYGEPKVRTPNLDQLASEGVRYTSVFCSMPVCSSNRSALMTGMHATTIDAQNHRSHRRDDYTLPEGVRVVTDWLRPAGYTTGLIWKGKKDFNFNYQGRAGKDQPYDTRDLSELLKKEPFFAQVQVSESHRGFSGPKRADPAKVDLPPYYPDHPLARKDWARYLDEIMVADRKFGKLMEKLEKAGVADDTVIFVTSDHGRAMLRAKDFVYDSGVHVPLLVRWPKSIDPPAHYKAGKVDERLISQIDMTATTLWAAGIKPPMLMQGRVFLGKRAGRLASLSSSGGEGGATHRRFAFSAQGRFDEADARIRTVRTKNYRYIRNWHPERPYFQRNEYKEGSYPVLHLMRKLYFQDKLTPVQAEYMKPDRPKQELYYIPDDPHNIHNLAGSDKSKHQRALDRLRAALDAWMVEANDQQRFPDPARVLKRAHTEDDDPKWKRWAKNHPEKYRLYRKMKAEWDRIDDDDANCPHRKRVWGEDCPCPLVELDDL